MPVIPKKIIEVLDDRGLSAGKVATIIDAAMGDDDITYYFPKAKILTFPELADVSNIEDLLPRDKTYFFLLFLSAPNSGHWTVVSRHNSKIEFFCSYGSRPEAILGWTKTINKQLGQSTDYLGQLFNKTALKVVYNPIGYQSKNPDVSDCGRFDCFRVYTILKYDMDLNKFHAMMVDLKKRTGKSYDKIVSEFIPKM
jgi:hypothetical protein